MEKEMTFNVFIFFLERLWFSRSFGFEKVPSKSEESLTERKAGRPSFAFLEQIGGRWSCSPAERNTFLFFCIGLIIK